ncbi:MAG: TolB family protein, partial [Thermoanaerobaculia bacterium]
ADAAGGTGIFRIDAQTGEVTAILHSGLCPPDCIEWPVRSSDGELIFARRTNEETNAARRIVSRDLASGREHELYRASAGAQVSHLAVSPDARRVAFIERNSKKGTSALKTMTADGSGPRELLRVRTPETIFDCAWTPDNRHLLFGTGSTGQNQRFKLWRISMKGGKAQELGLAMQGLQLYGLSVHPDGKRIAFTAGTPLRGELWVLEKLLPVPETEKKRE